MKDHVIMNTTSNLTSNRSARKIAIGLILALAIIVTLMAKWRKASRAPSPSPTRMAQETQRPSPLKLPTLIEFGAGKCVACKAMKPVLETLKRNYQGQLIVTSVDVWENAKEAERHNVRMIPTQVFFEPDGKELYRHTGFLTADAIAGEWAKLGYVFTTDTTGNAP